VHSAVTSRASTDMPDRRVRSDHRHVCEDDGSWQVRAQVRRHSVNGTREGWRCADVTYNLAPGVKRTLRGVELPWTAKVTGSSLFENWVLEAHSPTGARLTCSVALDGTPYSNSGSGSCWESVTSAVSTTTSTASPS